MYIPTEILQLGFNQSTYSVTEGAAATLNITLNIASSNEIVVFLQTMEGTATGNEK